MRYLRNVRDGTIYEWSDYLAANKLCVEVTEQEAFPEKFIPTDTLSAARKRQQETKTTLDFSTAEAQIPDQGPQPNHELNADASRNLPPIAGVGAGLAVPVAPAAKAEAPAASDAQPEG